MQRLSRSALQALGGAVLVAGLVAGCGASAASSGPPVSAGTPVPSVQQAFNPTDLAWIQLMVPMDEQLLRVLDMANRQSADPAVRRLAQEVTTTHRAELAQLVALRTRSGAPTTNVHEGHDMPGMMTEPEIVAMGKAQGAAFDQLFRKNLKEHLDQSIIVARSIKTAGHEPSVKKLAASIETGRAAQLKLLAAL